jgi:D-alanyl-D-alanine carboxypeptidase
MGRWRVAVGLALFALGLSVWLKPAQAQRGAEPSYVIMNAGSRQVLSSHRPNELRYPASLTKLMTLYLTFEALRDRRIALDQFVPVSAHAASMEPTKLGITPGTRITVRQCILGMITRSANDAASAMG